MASFQFIFLRRLWAAPPPGQEAQREDQRSQSTLSHLYQTTLTIINLFNSRQKSLLIKEEKREKVGWPLFAGAIEKESKGDEAEREDNSLGVEFARGRWAPPHNPLHPSTNASQ